MLNRIIRFSITNKLVVGMLMIALLAWGGYSVTQLPIDAVPDITDNQVQILTVAPSQSALDIERLVTFPVEQSVATIPDVEEVRSFSRFGLSVVTVVFKEHVDVYWARQQIAERMNTIKNIIPPEVGTPVLAPVSTGLGEIYQYIVRPKKGYESKYSVTDLRTIQDWIVRRQLLGVEGVADVGSFGGKLKQYEVALDPNKLKSMNTTIAEVFQALSENNQNTGGAYIDKKPNAYYIRSEGLIKNTLDIENILVKSTENGTPVLIRNVGEVREGFATRYGAMTYNDKGEVVGAVVMMLKGANSSKVINNVKERIDQIEKTLPEGLTIEPFLDRTKLVNNAIGTVTKNLAEGALIVIFILVLFLGNLRAGFIVASVIPLAMLFAISLMNVFGVSGNLMSLGAIDFGLIIDGAVIIVEATMHHLALRKGGRLSQKEMDKEVFDSASKIRNAAAFGEIIILIVYLPILALVGVEGKMFKPMAQTVGFAIVGAFLLSLTYVPMMSALFLSKNTIVKRTIADRIMDKIQRAYHPVLEWTLKQARSIVLISVFLFAGALALFNSLGAEFIPTLDEGNFAIDTRILLGSSLSETIDAATKSSHILLTEFPDEVKEVVSKVGSSEIPTDPMPIEACDLMVILKDKDQWTKAKTPAELADKMAEALKQLPGVNHGFQQPIQMRFNELMTGARQDVVIKVYGEDLNELRRYGDEIAALVPNIDGAKDIYVEKVTGLPQIVVQYKRDQLAKFGVSVSEVNQTINAAFAGQSTGLLYEGEKRFDIVVRLDEGNRQSIDDVRQLYIHTPSGMQVPLQQVADIHFVTGPNQIQRDDAKRRIVVGLNVRGRDVKSVVNEIKEKMQQNIRFEPGYYATFGGAFKNLEQATNRLMIAVPVALLLIFLLLFFTFQSVTQGLLIYTAIPLSAIGGIVALWVRDMPFSISAGVGFIALFGVSVLNGIVLLAEFNQLKAKGITDIITIIREGTHTRLRPVIMTALVASLGFLPMALSHGSGAEVQKPLATVVIGGLISATLLTLLVLPCLYLLVEKRKSKKVTTKVAMVIGMLMISVTSMAQKPTTISLDDAIKKALQQNQTLMAASQEKEAAVYQKRLSTELPKTDVSLMYGQYNGFYKNDNNVTIQQGIPFPGVMVAKSALGSARVESAALKVTLTRTELVHQVKTAYYTLVYLKAKQQVLLATDSIYHSLATSSERRHQKGDGTLLEKTSAESKWLDVKNQLQNNLDEIIMQQNQLALLLHTLEPLDTEENTPQELSLVIPNDSMSASSSPYVLFLKQQITLAEKEKNVSTNSSLPDLRIGYFNQSLYGVPLNDAGTSLAGTGNRFQGFMIGLSFPLWFRPDVAKAKSHNAQIKATTFYVKQEELATHAQYKQVVKQYLKAQRNLAYYNNTALPNSRLIRTQSEKAYQLGEISLMQHLFNLQQAISIQENHLQTQFEYNKAIINIERYTSK
ncbi:MAG: CusA/CzcA family heavy metal efflux RND transporter [Bacteroidota bacterium]